MQTKIIFLCIVAILFFGLGWKCSPTHTAQVVKPVKTIVEVVKHEYSESKQYQKADSVKNVNDSLKRIIRSLRLQDNPTAIITDTFQHEHFEPIRYYNNTYLGGRLVIHSSVSGLQLTENFNLVDLDTNKIITITPPPIPYKKWDILAGGMIAKSNLNIDIGATVGIRIKNVYAGIFAYPFSNTTGFYFQIGLRK